MSIFMTGGCACGSIRYECTAKPMLEYKCHCRACQRASGSGFVPLLWVPIDKIELTANEPKYYAVDCDSGREIKRGFCPDCGSHVMFQPGFPGILIVVAQSWTTLRNSNRIRKSGHRVLSLGICSTQVSVSSDSSSLRRISHIFFIVD